MAAVAEKHSNHNNNFNVLENTSIFATEIENNTLDDFILKKTDLRFTVILM